MIISLPFLFLPFFFFNVSQFYYLGLCSDVFHIILAALANCVFPLTQEVAFKRKEGGEDKAKLLNEKSIAN